MIPVVARANGAYPIDMLKTKTLRACGAVAIAAFVVSLAGCNTVRGVGDDLKGASNATERAITGEEKK